MCNKDNKSIYCDRCNPSIKQQMQFEKHQTLDRYKVSKYDKDRDYCKMRGTVRKRKGYYVFIPFELVGGISSDEMRTIADFLDKLNKK